MIIKVAFLGAAWLNSPSAGLGVDTVGAGQINRMGEFILWLPPQQKQYGSIQYTYMRRALRLAGHMYEGMRREMRDVCLCFVVNGKKKIMKATYCNRESVCSLKHFCLYEKRINRFFSPAFFLLL